MYEICRFLAATAPKAKKVRKPAAKAVKVGGRVVLFRNNTEYTVAERDTRYKNAWFLTDDAGNRLPYSFGRDDMKAV